MNSHVYAGHEYHGDALAGAQPGPLRLCSTAEDLEEGPGSVRYCIRGAQVLEELLSHPAIENKKAKAVKKSTSEPSETKKPGKRSALSML